MINNIYITRQVLIYITSTAIYNIIEEIVTKITAAVAPTKLYEPEPLVLLVENCFTDDVAGFAVQ